MKWSDVGKSPNPTVDVSPEAPTGDDRMLAAGAHLSTVLGMWIFIPAVIFFIRRKRPFVAFHALQAVVLSVLMMMLSFVLLAGVIFGSAILPAIIRALGDKAYSGLIVVGWVGLYVLCLAIPWIWSVIATLKAWDGKRYLIPFAGRITLRLLARDERLSGSSARAEEPSQSSWSGTR